MARLGAGKAYSLLLDNDGNMWGWGSNGYGQLANGQTEQCASPQKNPILPQVKCIYPGTGHCLAIDLQGNAYAWGWNRFGQSGERAPSYIIQPFKICTKRKIIDVAAGSYHTLLLDEDGIIFSFGKKLSRNFANTVSTHKLQQVKGSNIPKFIRIGAGEASNIALDHDGKLWSWGVDVAGNLGLGEDVTDVDYPTIISSIEPPISDFNCNGKNTIAVDIEGNTWIWGDNSKGQLCLKNSLLSKIPIRIDLVPSRKCTTGGGRVGIIDLDGNIWVWGNNRKDILGFTSQDEAIFEPTKLQNLPPMFCFTMGLTHCLALDMDGTLWSWGTNTSCELGIGNITDNVVEPVTVDLPFVPHHFEIQFSKTKSAKK